MLEIIAQAPITLHQLCTYLGEPQDRIMAELDRWIDSGVICVAQDLVDNSPLYFSNL